MAEYPCPADLKTFPDLGSESEGGGVYRILSSHAFARVRGSSRVVYIGSAGIFRKRLTGQHHILRRLRELSQRLGSATFSVELHPFATATKPKGLPADSWARLHETAALSSYEDEHYELPPLNGRGEGMLVGRALAVIAEALTHLRVGIRNYNGPWDEADNGVTYLTLGVRGGPQTPRTLPQILWTWPQDWWSDEKPWWTDPQAFGRKNPRLLADALHLFMPGPASDLVGGADVWTEYDFGEDGGPWAFFELGGSSWGTRVLRAQSDPASLLEAVSAPIATITRLAKAQAEALAR